MEQFNKYRSPIVLGILILFLVVFAFFMLGVKPTNKTISAQQTEMEQLEKETDILQKKIDKLKKESDPLNQKQKELLEALPKGDNSEKLILDLQEVGLLSNARLKDVAFAMDEANPIQQMTGSSEVKYPSVKQMKMTAVVEGTNKDIREWMAELQMLPRIVNIDSFNFKQPNEKDSEEGQAGIITANITFTAYYEEVK